MIEIITERVAWNDAIKSAKCFDFYHTYHYHDLSKKPGETPVLLKCQQGVAFVLLPLLLRDIGHTGYKDATSVYGYVGLLCSAKFEGFDTKKFKEDLDAFFLKRKIVSVFSRLHPYIECQDEILQGLGSVTNSRDIVYIDLKESLDLQRQNYSRRLKTQVNKARRLCSVIEGTTKEHIEAFVDIYYENMRRVDASEGYFFEVDYFFALMASSDFQTELSLALNKENGEIIAGVLFIKCNAIVQYHLSGIKADYLSFYPVKLLIDNMRIKSANEGYTYFNLGGGRSNIKDSLFRFKASFSKHLTRFKLWKYIINEDIYENLVRLGNENVNHNDVEADLDFFPAYRRFRNS